MSWQNFPLLLYGLCFYLGLTFQPISLIPICALLFSSLNERFLLAILVGITGFFWGYTSFMTLPGEGAPLHGSAYFRPSSLVKKTFHGKPSYMVHGTLKEFETDGHLYKGIPIFMTFGGNKGPEMSSDWQIEGALRHGYRGWIFKPHLDKPFRKISKTFSLAEARHQTKEKLKKYITKKLKEPQAASLISGLATGEMDDRGLSFDFARFGLSHLLAISGFHFSLLAALLALVIRPFFNFRITAWLLIFFLGLYFIFLGSSPSVFRAAVAAFLVLTAPLQGQLAKAENSLGLALLIILILDPFAANYLGFQLSFLCTASLLIFNPLVEKGLITWFPKIFVVRSAKEIYAFSKFNRLGAFLSTFIRKSLCLNLSLAIIGIPATLFLFHQFPLLSLFYNLFFPLLLSFSLILFLVSLFIPWLHSLNASYTHFILSMVHELPPHFDFMINTKFFNKEITITLIVLLFYFGLLNKVRLKYTSL